MSTLWGDGWFYISTLGFLVSSALFLYLLGQYRSAVEASEESDEAPVPEPVPAPAARPVAMDFLPPPVVTPIVARAKEEKTLLLAPQEAAAPAPALSGSGERPPSKDGGPQPAGYTGPDRRRSELTASGGISPAVVYLQNIKSQMEKFDKEISTLKALASQQAAQGEQMLKRLSELAQALKTGATPVSSLPAPTRSVELSLESAVAPAPELTPVPAPIPEPVPEPAPAPALSGSGERPPSEDGGPLPAAPEPAPAPAPEPVPKPAPAPDPVVIEALPMSSEQTAELARPRKGPVWPV